MTTLTLVTADEFANFVARPENSDRWFELERGEIVELPPPKNPHGIVCGNIARILGNYAVQTKSGYVTSNDAGYITERSPDSVRGPDVAFWNDAETGNVAAPVYTETPPIIAIEVLSPEDRINGINRKIREYLVSGVREVWIADPASRDVAIHRTNDAPVFFSDDNEIDGGSTLPGFRCKVSEFFRSLTTSG